MIWQYIGRISRPFDLSVYAGPPSQFPKLLHSPSSWIYGRNSNWPLVKAERESQACQFFPPPGLGEKIRRY